MIINVNLISQFEGIFKLITILRLLFTYFDWLRLSSRDKRTLLIYA